MSATPSTPSPPSLLRGQLQALVAHTVREARHKWTLVALFLLTSLFLLLLATLVNVDVVEGTIASAKLFGTMEIPLGDQSIRITEAVTVLQSVLVGFVGSFGLLLALFVTGNVVPRTLEPGWVDLLVAQPLPRWALIVGRALGAMAVVALSLLYLFGGSWAILAWKTGFGNAGFLLAGLLILVTYMACYAGMVLVGVLTRSSPLSIVAGVGIWALGGILLPLHRFEWTTVFRAGWPRTLASVLSETLYWSLPKTAELTRGAIDATQMEGPRLLPLLSSLPFLIVCIGLACWWFTRQDT